MCFAAPAGLDSKYETLTGFAWSLRLRDVMETASNLADVKAFWEVWTRNWRLCLLPAPPSLPPLPSPPLPSLPPPFLSPCPPPFSPFLPARPPFFSVPPLSSSLSFRKKALTREKGSN